MTTTLTTNQTSDARHGSADDPINYTLFKCMNECPNPPVSKRTPAGWSTFALVPGIQTLLRQAVGESKSGNERAWLRLTTAVDDRVQRIIVVALPSGKQLGVLDLRFAHAIEIFQLELIGDDVLEALHDGVTLRLEGDGDPIWFFSSSGYSNTPLPIEYHPHLMTAQAAADPSQEYHNRFASLASLQGFGWMEGCILDGLRSLERFGTDNARYRKARKAHWQNFAGIAGELSYESPRSVVFTNKMYGIEGCLPFADLAFDDPHHPWLAYFETLIKDLQRPDGTIQDDEFLSAEGSYTVAFPLAALAVARKSPEWAELALKQLRIRQSRLWHDGAIWLRFLDDGQRTFRNWARAVSWYFLGLIRTLEILRDGVRNTADLEAEARRVAEWILPKQNTDGLWSVYVDAPELAQDTSGSAGIATALALGARIGILPMSAADAAARTLAGLVPHLTPDGFLGGTSQSNRGGEVLQRSDYRVLSQMAMGLKAQLLAELRALSRE